MGVVVVVGCWEGLLHWGSPTSFGTFVQMDMVSGRVCMCLKCVCLLVRGGF